MNSTSALPQPSPARRKRAILPRHPAEALRSVAIVGAYAAAFVLLHHVAARWGMGALYSLWFPGAGLRFAFLWRMGPRITPWAALAELLLGLLSGELRLGAAPLLSVTGVVGPCLVYGLVIFLVQARAGRRTPMLRLAPLPFALAAVIGPLAASVAALPWAIPAASAAGPLDARALVTALAVFTLGDMLGVLILAPPLLWLAERIAGTKPWRVKAPKPLLLVEAVLIVTLAWVFVWVLVWAGLGLNLAPPLLATCWVGLRTGRPGAWSAIIVAAVVILPITANVDEGAARLSLHMMLACIAAVGYLAGSFAEAEARSRLEIGRRDRMLFQAERLKTLRAMSVAVIHEISQPLSTIAIEAAHLAGASKAPVPDMAEIEDASQLIARKAQDLAAMVRRLRGFGGGAADAPSPIPVSLLLADLAVIAAPEAKASRVSLEIIQAIQGAVVGQDIELRQALLNLVRNAISASPSGGRVGVVPVVRGERLLIVVDNDVAPDRAARSGMGVGLIIARSIAAAHGGEITQDHPAPDRTRFTLDLPMAGDHDE